MRHFWQIIVCVLFLSVFIRGESSENPHVVLQTGFGDIEIEIYESQAPITASNFLSYVDRNLFKDACFYRVVRMDNQPHDQIKIQVIQGGLRFSQTEKFLPSIEHETTEKTGILHKDGVISMARSNPGTASSEFFICVEDQPELDYGGERNPDGQGFAAFGKVFSGMEVVREILQQPSEGQMLISRVKIFNIVRVD
jgi:peptidyl-prolyl cis-trans isomerase A (cyclophilin A)